MARDAVIVSTARTPIGNAYNGAFNATPSPTLAAHPIRAAIERAEGRPGARSTTSIMGAALQQGTQTHHRPHRRASRRLPGHRRRHDDRPPMRVGADGHRHRRQADHHRPHGRRRRRRRGKHQPGPDRRNAHRPGPALLTHAQGRLHADARHRRDGRRSATASAASAATNMRCARSSAPPQAQAAGRFDDEIVPVTATMAVKDKETGEVSQAAKSRSPRTRAIAPTRRSRACRSSTRCSAPRQIITAGNASQLSRRRSASS